VEEFVSIVEESSPVYNIRHRAFYFSKDIILFVSRQHVDLVFNSVLDQLVRSATSIGANLVEGIAGASKNDFIKYNIIALKSANETKYSLCLNKETLIADKENIDGFIHEADEIAKIVASIVINSRKNK
jgi:four helix bundle protein